MKRSAPWNNPDGTRMECKVPDCDRPVRSRGLCASCYRKWQRTGSEPKSRHERSSVPGRSCSANGCSMPVMAKGWCSTHYSRMRRNGSLETVYPKCGVPHCDKRMMPTSKICKSCYGRMWRYGISVEAFLEMCQEGNYRCQNLACESTDKLHIDHDHSCCLEASNLRNGTKACGNCVRGWLCSGCNTALGLLKEDRGRIAGLSAYLERFTR